MKIRIQGWTRLTHTASHRTPTDHAAQVLNTWSAGGKLVQAALMVIWGVLATLTNPLTAIIWSGVFLLATPLLLPQRQHMLDTKTTAVQLPQDER
ncbi:hypothetical protein [Rhodococcoides fascians]|uniref:hypothetical protein n=1 Tax=Rhodococcoides fascians TaxID=1828 RepID=UPI00056C4058